MATATMTPPKTRRMIEVKAPEMFQFTDQHRTAEGVLIDISEVEVKGKTTLQFTLREDRGKRITFLATHDLERKIQREHIGHYMNIRYEGEDQNVQTQGSKLRKFYVTVCPDLEPSFTATT